MKMKLFDTIEVLPLLEHGKGYIAVTRNHNGAVVGWGNSIETAISALIEAVKILRTPPIDFDEHFGPRNAQEWHAEQGDWTA